MEKDEEISEDIKELVIARLGIMPSNYKLSIGTEGTFTKKELIEHVIANDKTGRQIAKMQLHFIKALTTGKFIDTLNKYE
mgnify:FL=1